MSQSETNRIQLRILSIEDNRSDFVLLREMLKDTDEAETLEIEWESEPETGLNRLETDDFDVCFLDYNLGAMTGSEVLDLVASKKINTPIIILTGAKLPALDEQLILSGATDYLLKDEITPGNLSRAMRYAIFRKQSELELNQLRRWETLGMIAAGVAHDFGNLLAVLSSRAKTVGKSIPPEDTRAQESLLAIQKSVARATELTQSMRLVAGNSLSTSTKFNINEVILSARTLLENTAAIEHGLDTTQLIFTLDKNLPKIRGDRSLLRMVVDNIVWNALEAIKEKRSGTVNISTVRQRRRKDIRYSTRKMAEGEYVHLVVSDNGLGINKEHLNQIFEPFYSTKFLGRGLGLAATKGIVEAHGGYISIESTLNIGTTFDVAIPVASISTLPPPNTHA